MQALIRFFRATDSRIFRVRGNSFPAARFSYLPVWFCFTPRFDWLFTEHDCASMRMPSVAQSILSREFFPTGEVDWRTYPDFVGHKNWMLPLSRWPRRQLDGKNSIKTSD